jgi:YidC/Oxa1 family membrane protein insertase
MNPNSEKPSFMDRNTLLAFALILGFWFGWAKYMENRYPSPPQEEATIADQRATGAGDVGQEGSASPSRPAAQQDQGAAQTSAQEFLVDYSDGKMSFQVSSFGMGLKNISVEAYKSRSGDPIVLGTVGQAYPFSTSLAGSSAPIQFAIEKTAPNTFVGTANVSGMEITKTMKVNSANYTIDTEVNVTGIGSGFTGVVTTLNDTLQEPLSGSLFAPSYDYQDWFLSHAGTTTREIIYKTDPTSLNVPNVAIAALSDHYFSLAIVDRSDLLPRFESRIPVNSETAPGQLIYQPPTRQSDELTIRFTAFAGPKSFSVLESVDDGLTRVIDYGIFAIVAKPILWLLKAIHSGLGNWGWAIVVLTIIVRVLVLPFNIVAFKSMKAMQKIQPEMNRIRERYKEKPADQRLQMNQEIMDLMKRHKANPLGGCLPMLLQLPVFIALYQVLSQSIELYQAPFMLWINDLSVKDPFFVLPVLMGATMFLQQKLTPTTMDPQQAKIMMWMPVIFSFFMLSLPSGLTLYIFVSTLFGVVQQMILMRDKSPVPSVKEAKA